MISTLLRRRSAAAALLAAAVVTTALPTASPASATTPGGLVTGAPVVAAPGVLTGPMPSQRYNGEVRGVVGAWGGFRNGEIPTSRLCSPSWTSRHFFRCDAAAAFEDLNRAFKGRFGRNLAITSTYRTYAQQVKLKAEKPTLAATPGTSNHGWGLAVDLSGGIQTFGSPEHSWMRANANAYGFFHPSWAQINGSLPEAWHWEYAGVVASGDVRHTRALGRELARSRSWGNATEQQCLTDLWQKASGWNYTSVDGDLAGVARTDMRAVFGASWRKSSTANAFLKNPVAQVERGLADVTDRFGSACRALHGKVIPRIDAIPTLTVEAGGHARLAATTAGDFAWTATVTDPRSRRLVRELSGTARESAGGLALTWDTRTATGVVVGPGRYEVRVSGKTSWGEAVPTRTTHVEVTGTQRPVTVAAVPLTPNLQFVPVTPARVLDTRPEFRSIGPGSRVDVQVAGVHGVPADAKAVALNVTAVGASRSSFVQVWPAGLAASDSSTINADARRPEVAAGVLVGVGGEGKVSLSNNLGSMHLVVDVTGYFVETGGAGYGALPMAFRALDTRLEGGLAMTDRGVRTVPVAGQGGVPADASAVVVNVTTVRPAGPGNVAVVPHGTGVTTSSVNHLPGHDVANRATVALRDGKLDVHLAGGAAHVVVDVVGWYGSGATARFTPISPVRAADTREGAPLGEGEARTLPLVAGSPVPADAVAAAVTLTATQQTAFATHLITWPAGAQRPDTSDLNTGARRDQANSAVVGLGTGGAVDVYNDTGETHVVVDVTGFFR